MQPASVFALEFCGDATDAAFDTWREQIGRHLLRCDYQAVSPGQVRIEHRIHLLPQMTVGKFSTSPVRASRYRNLIENDSGDVLMVLGVSGTVGMEQDNDQFDLKRGHLGILDVSRPSMAINDGICLGLRLDRYHLKSYCPHVEDLFGKPLPQVSSQTRLLLRYLEILTDLEPELDAKTIPLVQQHVVDLVGLVLGATGDMAEQAKRGGLRAARAKAIRHAIAQKLGDHALTLSSLARELGISERYVQLIFEDMQTSFTDYVLEQRLLLANRMLLNPVLIPRRISDIAYDVGFGDLSHFNRSFRRRFDATPSDVRKRAALERFQS